MYPVENRSSNAAAAVNRISAQRKFAGSQMEETQNYVRGQMIYQAEIPSYVFNYSSPEAVSDANIRCNFNQRVTGCPSCCPALGQAHPSHIPIFGVNNHRRSVIMVPVSWNSTVSHIPLVSTISKFNLCSFNYVENLRSAAKRKRGRRLMRKAL